MSREEMTERFWSRVDKSGDCWTHSGAKNSPRGYPQCTGINGSVLAHRMSWELNEGPIPKGAWVLHLCNNRSCVRPSHLSLGTHQQNMDDLARAGTRTDRKLTAEQVRTAIEDTRSVTVVAQALGVSRKAVYSIRRGLTYRYEQGISR